MNASTRDAPTCVPELSLCTSTIQVAAAKLPRTESHHILYLRFEYVAEIAMINASIRAIPQQVVETLKWA